MKKCHWNYQAHSIARSSRNILSEPLFYTIYHNTISNTLRTTVKLYIHKKNSTFVFYELWVFMKLYFSLEIARMTDNEWVYFSISMSLTEFQLKLMRRGRCLSTHTKLIVAPLIMDEILIIGQHVVSLLSYCWHLGVESGKKYFFSISWTKFWL